MARTANNKSSDGAGGHLDSAATQRASKDLGGFAADGFEPINRKGGGFAEDCPGRVVGAGEMPPAGERDANAALGKLGPLSTGRSDKTKSAPVTMPTEAGGPLPQGTPTGR